MEYSYRKKKTRQEEFLEIMDEIIPWDKWVSLIIPHYPAGNRGRPPTKIKIMLRMYLLQCWFSLSDEGVEDATTLLHFRHPLEEHGIGKLFFDAINRCLGGPGE